MKEGKFFAVTLQFFTDDFSGFVSHEAFKNAISDLKCLPQCCSITFSDEVFVREGVFTDEK